MFSDQEKTKTSKFLSVAIGAGIAILIFTAVLVIGLLTGWFGFASKDVDVPNFIGLRASDVVENSEYKFSFKIDYSYDSSKPEDVIIDQDPKAGTKKVKENSQVTLVVNSSGANVTVPNLKGKTEDVAKSTLKESGFLCEVLYVEDSETAKGIVIGTEPESGKEVAANSTIKLFVSKGPAEKTTVIPNVVGKSLNDAITELTNKSLKVSEEIVKEKSDKEKDTVIKTSPLPGTEVKEGSSVKLTVSTGEALQKTVSVYVDLPSDVTKEVTLKVYIDGVLDSSKKIIPAYSGTYTVTVKGSSGKKSLVINLDDQKYRTYEVDFDNENVNKTAVSAFKTTSATKRRN